MTMNSVLPVELNTDFQEGIDEVIRSLFPVGDEDIDFRCLDFQRCNERALTELASLVGVGAPNSVAFSELLCIQCRRRLVENAWQITQHGTEAALDAFAHATSTTYDFSLLRDSNGIAYRINLSVNIAPHENTIAHQDYYTAAYTELLPLVPERNVVVRLGHTPATALRRTRAVALREFFYPLAE